MEDLKITYQCDLLNSDTGGYDLVSHIVFSKLSPELQKAMIMDLKTTYPTLNEIADNYDRIIKMIVKTKQNQKKYDNGKQGTGEFKSNKFNSSVANFVTTPGVVNSITPQLAASNNFNNNQNNNYIKNCRFCNINGHVSTYCHKYSTYNQRVDICTANNLCTKCTSNRHVSADCTGSKNGMSKPCKFCNKLDHVACMCPTKPPSKPRSNNYVCLSSSEDCPSQFCNKYDHVAGMCPTKPPSKPRSNNYVCLSSSEDDPSQFLLPVLEMVME